MTSALSGARAFRHRDFIRYWSSRFVSATATLIQGVAVGWWVYVGYAIATLAAAGLLGCAWRPRVAFRHEPGASPPPGSASRRRHRAGTPP